MTVQLIVQIALFLSALTCLISAGFVTSAMIGEVNRRLPEKDQISYLWGHYSKYRKINLEYRRLYPAGRLIFYNRLLTFAGFGFVLALVLGWRFGLFH
jgi:hypothetical protein